MQRSGVGAAGAMSIDVSPPGSSAASIVAGVVPPLRVLSFLRVGSCILHAAGSDAPPCPFRVAKLGLMLVAAQGQLSRDTTVAHRLRVLNHDILSLRGKHCIVAVIIPPSALSHPSTASTTAASLFAAAHNSPPAAAHSSSLTLMLRRLLHALEGTCDGFLSALQQEHEKAVEEMVKQDGIHKQLNEQKRADNEEQAASSDASLVLSGTSTIPQLARFEQLAKELLLQRDLTKRWFKPMFRQLKAHDSPLADAPKQPLSQLAAVYIVRFDTAAANNDSCILLSHSVAQMAAGSQLIGPAAPHQWTLVLTYARALIDRYSFPSSAAALPSSSSSASLSVVKPLTQLALYFPPFASSPPLLIHLRLVDIPLNSAAEVACLIAFEIGSAQLQEGEREKQQRGALPVANWISPIDAVADAIKDEEQPLLPPSHPIHAELQAFPSSYFVLRDELLLPEWSSLPSGAADEKHSTVWRSMQATVRLIEEDFPLPAQLKRMYDPASALSSASSDSSSPPLAAATTVSPHSTTSVQSPPSQTSSTAGPDSVDVHVAAAPVSHVSPTMEEKEESKTIRPIAPVPPSSQPPILDAGTGSFRRKVSITSTSAAAASTGSMRPHPPSMPPPHPSSSTAPLSSLLTAEPAPYFPPSAPLAHSTLLDSLPLSRTGSFTAARSTVPSSYPSPQLPNEANSHAAAAPSNSGAVELSMDTPRLQTTYVSTPRDMTLQRRDSNDGSKLPPVERRASGGQHVTLASKLQAAATSASAERSDSDF